MRLTGLVAALALVVPALAADDKKATPKDKPDTKDTTKWVSAGEIQVTLTRVDGPQKTVAFNQKIPYRNGRSLAYKDVENELHAADDIKVRMPSPPVEFDLKGNPKKYTSKELRELKGPGNLWGYPADFDSLKSGQLVRLFLKKPKDAPRYKRDKNEDKDSLQENKPVISMVYIIAEPKK
jgi:hypothetical protein